MLTRRSEDESSRRNMRVLKRDLGQTIARQVRIVGLEKHLLKMTLLNDDLLDKIWFPGAPNLNPIVF
jgi:hypothetical protein